ncbi:protein-disulfide reductase DsbD [Zobellella maritima]|uniref:protein-disulfide reductase DsbD n=1 Tax=Zobellella maritima TaxID=2059725 RepID=UPI000E304618|nr:protein-disulfide reductase DsbD [Zobellella maritima]
MLHRIHILLVCCLLASPASAGLLERLAAGNSAPVQDAFLRVEQAFRVDSWQQNGQLVIHVDIEPDYYLYRHSISLSTEGAELGQWLLPEGTPHEDEYFGKSQVYYQNLQLRLPLENVDAEARVSFAYQGCTTGLCYPPERLDIALDAVADGNRAIPTAAGKGSPVDTRFDASEQGLLAATLSSQGVWLNMGVFLLLGIGLAFTPCVFPMYPILTGIIAGSGRLSTARALWLSFVYVQGMALTYTLLGLVVASIGLQAQAAFQHPLVLVILALLFGMLALSMFGLYELRLPNHLQTRLAGLANRQRGGSTPGVAAMGMISGLVCSPCTTAPLSGALLYVAHSGDLVLGGLVLYALSLGMGVPLLILGTSGGKLLPRAGAWMHQVKALFGFGLLAVAILLLARLLSDSLIVWLWLALALMLIGYLYHQNRRRALSALRSAITLGLTAGLALTLLSGWQQLQKPEPAGQPVGFTRIKTVDDLALQLAFAREQGKTVMVDLYADWCVACKDFEHKTFSQPGVQQRLQQMHLLQADVTGNDTDDIELLNELKVLGLPTLVFFDKHGEEPAGSRITGFMGADAFAEHLARHRMADG